MQNQTASTLPPHQPPQEPETTPNPQNGRRGNGGGGRERGRPRLRIFRLTNLRREVGTTRIRKTDHLCWFGDTKVALYIYKL